MTSEIRSVPFNHLGRRFQIPAFCAQEKAWKCLGFLFVKSLGFKIPLFPSLLKLEISDLSDMLHLMPFLSNSNIWTSCQIGEDILCPNFVWEDPNSHQASEYCCFDCCCFSVTAEPLLTGALFLLWMSLRLSHIDPIYWSSTRTRRHNSIVPTLPIS